MAPAAITDYRVGIICALPKEMAAVQAMLDEMHESLGEQDEQDDNNYLLGRIHKHNVVITCQPVGIYGTATAAIAARDMLRTFPGVRVGLMVGIGGGIPDLQKNDIRLGDIVVSQPDGIHGGVVQHDLGTRTSLYEFEHKGSLDKPPRVLLSALSSLKARHNLVDSKIPAYMREAYDKYPKLRERGYAFPGTEEDVLYCPDCSPVRSWWTFRRCNLCHNGRIERDRHENTDPLIHYGTIASGGCLIEDVKYRDALGKKFGAKCVMDNVGLTDQFRCMVIRGICDYADSYKNNVWQEYAALAAAAFAKELLEFLVSAKIADEKPMSEVNDILREDDTILSEQINIAAGYLQENQQYFNKPRLVISTHCRRRVCRASRQKHVRSTNYSAFPSCRRLP